MALSPEQIKATLRAKSASSVTRSTSQSAPPGTEDRHPAQISEPQLQAKVDKSASVQQALPAARRARERPYENVIPLPRTGSPVDIQRAPPHSVEAEQGVLGSMLQPGEQGKVAFAAARARLAASAFYLPANQTLFQIMCDMDDQGKAIDIITLGEALREVGQEQKVGGPAYYTGLFTFVPSAANIDYYLDIVMDNALRREIIASSTESARRAYDQTESVEQIATVAHQRFGLISAGRSTRGGRLPDLADISHLLNGARPPRPTELVKNLLHQGSKLIVGGTSKGRKTFSLIDLALSVATGTQWWGFETARGPVCYINFEIQESFFCERVADILRVKKLELQKDMFMGWNLRGHSEGIENLMGEIVAKITSRHFSLVIFDPIYKGLGERDENKAGDIASLMNQLERVAVKTGAAIAFGAHYSKGNQALKESIDRIGGSGVFARDPDSILTMTAHEEPEAFTVECTLRNFPPIEPFVLKWDWPLFIRTDLDPEALKQPRKRNSGTYAARYSKEALLDELSVVDGVRPGKLFRRLAEMEGISRAQFYRLAKQLKDDGRLQERAGEWFKLSIKTEK